MILNILKQFNWVDIFVVILLIRISYVAIKNGAFPELFKFLGVVLGTYLSLHYYTKLADFLKTFVKSEVASIELFDLLSLIILIVLGYIIAALLREGLMRFIKVEVLSTVNKWAALILGLLRGILVSSLLIYLFSLPVISYLKKSAADSFLSRRIVKVAPSVYQGIWNNFMSKFMPQEKFNQAILEVQKDYLK
jgi:uncharacterized membrane protein required for colicin V production